jgi:hypothetical protein
MKRWSSPTALCLALLVLTALTGCGGTSVEMVPVRGKVTVGSLNVADGNVSFIPATQGDVKVGMSAGQIKDGEFAIFTDGKAGVPAGQYKVTVTPQMVPTAGGGPPATLYNKKYSSVATTTLNVKVPSDNYDLKLEK